MTTTARSAQILSDLAHEGPVGDGKDLLFRLVTSCAQTLPVTGVGLVVMTDMGPGNMLAATDGPARLMEELQFTLGEGPCVDASISRRPVLQPDLARTGPARWPGFAAGALEAGIAAIFALPLQVGGIRVGVLDIYRDVPGVLEDADLGVALAFADSATTVLLHLQADARADELNPGLTDSIGFRAEVHQATGMIAIQAAVTLAQALVLLRARAFAAERPISDVARDVVDRLLRFDV